MTRSALTAAIRSVLSRHPQIPLCILFGSAAADRMTHASDVDIAVAGSVPLGTEGLDDLRQDLVKSLGREIDLLDMDALDGLILKEVLTGGEVIRNEESCRLASFMKKMWFYEADMMPNYRMILARRAEVFAHEHDADPA